MYCQLAADLVATPVFGLVERLVGCLHDLCRTAQSLTAFGYADADRYRGIAAVSTTRTTAAFSFALPLIRGALVIPQGQAVLGNRRAQFLQMGQGVRCPAA